METRNARSRYSYLLWRIIEAYPTLGAIEESATMERLINKSDADYIFSLDRAGWETYAERMVHPGGWKVHLSRHDAGTGVFALDAASGVGLSTQPLFKDDTGPPVMLIVTSYYQIGRYGH